MVSASPNFSGRRYGAPYNALSGEVRAAIADLAALKYEVLGKVGDAVGNTQASVICMQTKVPWKRF